MRVSGWPDPGGTKNAMWPYVPHTRAGESPFGHTKADVDADTFTRTTRVGGAASQRADSGRCIPERRGQQHSAATRDPSGLQGGEPREHDGAPAWRDRYGQRAVCARDSLLEPERR